MSNALNAVEPAIDWPQVLEQHRPWLTKVLRARIGDNHDVEDVYQEIVLAVLKQVKKSFEEITRRASNGGKEMPRMSIAEATSSAIPEDPEKIAPWLYRIAIRHVVNFYRRTNRISHAKACSDLEPFSKAPQPLDWMMAVEQKDSLLSAMDSLRPQDREILTLKYQENWSYQQMAEHLGVPIRNIEYRLLNARNRLRQQLSNTHLNSSQVATSFPLDSISKK